MAKSAEFFLDPDSHQLVALEPCGSLFANLLHEFSTKTGLQTVECANNSELISMCRQLQVCLVVAHCPKVSEAQRCLDLLKALQADILGKRIRVIISVGADFLDLQSLFFKAGASEVVLDPGEKAIAGKVEHALSLLPSRKSLNAKKQTKDPARATSSLGAAPTTSVKWVAPLELESDCWIAVKDGIKSVAGKWIVPIIGPSPRFGQWCAKSPSTGEQGEWEWVPTQLLDDPFIREEGAWVFSGRRPDFQGGAWIFIGAKAELSFIYGGESYGSKFSANTGEKDVLVIAEDSTQARKAAGSMEKSPKSERVAPENSSQGNTQASNTSSEDAPLIEVQKPYSITDALTFQSDCFAREERIPRFMNGNWVMKLAAPTPAHGKWEVVRREESEEAIWQWIPKPSKGNDPFITDTGMWIFQGNQPHYKDGLWAFIGKKPRLEFVTDLDPQKGRVVARRISVDSRGFFVLTEDSIASKGALEKLQSYRKKPPTYLKRNGYGTKLPSVEDKRLFADSPFHPFVAAFFISEMLAMREAPPRHRTETESENKADRVLRSFCDQISRYHTDTKVEAWIYEGRKWRCLQHEDLMDFSLLQRTETIQPQGDTLQFKVLDVGGTAKAVLAMSDGRKVGMLVFSGPKAVSDDTAEFEAYTRACAGVWIALGEAAAANRKIEAPVATSTSTSTTKVAA